MKNIVLISCDQLRADYVPWHVDCQDELPNLSRFSQGAVFTRCNTVNPLCMPARCSLLSGKYSHQIGCLSMSGELHPEVPSFPKVLQEQGYETYHIGKSHWHQAWPWGTKVNEGYDFVRDEHLIKDYGYDTVWESAGKQLCLQNHCHYTRELKTKASFEKYCQHIKSLGGQGKGLDKLLSVEPKAFPLDDDQYVDIATCDVAVEHIKQSKKDKPFFMHLSFCGPHPPYDPPQKYLDQAKVNENFVSQVSGVERILSESDKVILQKYDQAYRAMILCIDDQVGRVFEAFENANQYKDTVFIFTSDHGEMLGDKEQCEKMLPWWQSLRIPLAVLDGTGQEALQCDKPIELTDVTASILDVAGLSVEALDKQEEIFGEHESWPQFSGSNPARSFMPIVYGKKKSIRDFSFAEFNNQNPNFLHWQAIEDERYKYFRDTRVDLQHWPKEYLFDHHFDPDEKANLAEEPEKSELLQTMRKRLDYTLQKTPAVQFNHGNHLRGRQ